MNSRKLRLRREALSDLCASDMERVVGATHIATDCGCITHGYTCDQCQIFTLPLNSCPVFCTIETDWRVCGR